MREEASVYRITAEVLFFQRGGGRGGGYYAAVSFGARRWARSRRVAISGIKITLLNGQMRRAGGWRQLSPGKPGSRLLFGDIRPSTKSGSDAACPGNNSSALSWNF